MIVEENHRAYVRSEDIQGHREGAGRRCTRSSRNLGNATVHCIFGVSVTKTESG
jgi:hypothetical protein